MSSCDSDWDRTNNLLLRRQLLYPLSYGAIVGMTRFELAASSSRTKRATGLRYIPFELVGKSTNFSLPTNPFTKIFSLLFSNTYNKQYIFHYKIRMKKGIFLEKTTYNNFKSKPNFSPGLIL